MRVPELTDAYMAFTTELPKERFPEWNFNLRLLNLVPTL